MSEIERDPLGGVGLVEVDASDVATRAELVALVEVVLAAQDEVDVLVGLGLVGLVRRLGQGRAVERVVAVVRDAVGESGLVSGRLPQATDVWVPKGSGRCSGCRTSGWRAGR